MLQGKYNEREKERERERCTLAQDGSKRRFITQSLNPKKYMIGR
jgi:hypothetical protein